MAKLWKNCIGHSFYGDDRRSDIGRCEVRIGDGRISVTYEYEGGKVRTYEGAEIGEGHFDLKATDGKASLHRFSPDGRLLDGWWAEEGQEGMWRIFLNE